MRNQKGFWLKIVLFTSILSLIIWISARSLFPQKKQFSPVLAETPKIIGLTVKQAEKKLKTKGLCLKIKSYQRNSNLEKGMIISQLPLPGEEIQKNGVVYVIVSLGIPTPTLTSQLPTIPLFKTSVPFSQTLSETQSTERNSFSQFVVCIDPGHQARANLQPEPIGPGSRRTKPKVAGGGTGVVSKTPESQIVLKIALKLQSKLKAQGIKVVMTRIKEEVNISNRKRAEIANRAGADLFVRIHLDSSTNQSLRGITTFYPAKNHWTKKIYMQSRKAAQIVHFWVIKETGAFDRGLKERGDMTGFNWSKVPAILIEAGFLSNPSEDQKLNTDDYQNKVATGLAKGVLDYLK